MSVERVECIAETIFTEMGNDPYVAYVVAVAHIETFADPDAQMTDTERIQGVQDCMTALDLVIDAGLREARARGAI